jgi:fatty-acyl-CoA synthase
MEGSPIFAAIARQAEARPKATALRHPPPSPGHEPWSWELLRQDAEFIAAFLHEEGTRVSSHPIAWLQHNHPHAITTLLACAHAGFLHVPLNWRLSEEELRWIETHAGISAVLDHESDLDWSTMPPVDLPFGIRHPYVEGLVGPDRPCCLSAEAYAAGLCSREVWVRLRELAARVTAATPLLLCYTSGTTGRPKGAMLTQGAVMANAAHAQAIFEFTEEDRVLTVLPLFHLGGLCIQTLPALFAGAEVILHPRFEPDAFFDSLEHDKPTLTLLVPAVMQALVAHPRWAAADLSCLRAIGAGSSDVPLALIEAFHAKGVPVQQVYGMTEAGPIAIAQSVAEAWAHPGSIGFPVGDCEARIDAHGEIQLRGPNFFSGYWRDETSTAAAFTTDGWFRTGDAGRMDEDGRFWFTDRLKHLIISGGENIAPAEVERVLRTAPGVREGVVIGRPDARWGEVAIAIIVAEDHADDAAILAHFEGKLARFKHPRAVYRVPAMPRTALGKVQVEKLRALLPP